MLGAGRGPPSVPCRRDRDHSGEIDARVSVSALWREQPVSGDNADRAEQREVDEKELVAGGVESVRGMHRLRARINIISRLLTES